MRWAQQLPCTCMGFRDSGFRELGWHRKKESSLDPPSTFYARRAQMATKLQAIGRARRIARSAHGLHAAPQLIGQLCCFPNTETPIQTPSYIILIIGTPKKVFPILRTSHIEPQWEAGYAYRIAKRRFAATRPAMTALMNCLRPGSYADIPTIYPYINPVSTSLSRFFSI